MKQVLIAIDQLANALTGGMADETLSARAWRNRHRHSAHRLIDALFFFDRDEDKRHCQLSFESELERRQLPVAYRDLC